MFDVTVFPDTHPRHSSPIYAGLFELEHRGEVRVRFHHRRPAPLRGEQGGSAGHTLWLELSDARQGVTRRVCFDMEDSHAFNAHTRLAACDVYFKRSYSRAGCSVLPHELRAKVLPYGLYAPCSSPYERGLLARAWHYRKRYSGTAAALRAVLAAGRSAYLRRRNPWTMKYHPYPFMSDWAQPLMDAPEPLVLFQTRVWDPVKGGRSTCEELERLNSSRAELVRALRAHFGSRFVGGLQPSPYAASRYPDCLTNHGTSPAAFMKFVKQCAVAVTSTGLHGSIGARLAEYVAAGRAIVTETLPCELPVPLVEGRNLLSFDTVDQCVAACDRLLTDEAMAARMRRANRRYFETHLDPAAQMARCLQSAFESVPSVAQARLEPF